MIELLPILYRLTQLNKEYLNLSDPLFSEFSNHTPSWWWSRLRTAGILYDISYANARVSSERIASLIRLLEISEAKP